MPSRAIRDYHDFLSYVIVSAPNRFPVEDYLSPEEQMHLEKAFAQLTREFDSVDLRVKDGQARRLLRELLQMALEAYQSGHDIRGAQILQEFEGLVWPKHRLRERFAPEAARRIAEHDRDGR